MSYYLPVFAYFLGSIPFAVPVSKAFGLPSPYSYGSGNPGATNVLRSGGQRGKTASAITLLLDALKGALPVAVAQLTNSSPFILFLTVLAVFIGHLYPIFYRFKGGKGVATAAGILWALDWRLGAAVTLVWVAIAKLLRISSLAAISAALLAPCISGWLWTQDFRTAAVMVMCLLLLWRHRTNIQRLLKGEESVFKR
ncbi:MAG: glycerol-3-phosphate 1-O-acyltransferase PlsY [Pseudomonadota bacterium]